MSRKWKPGDVAMVTDLSGDNHVALFVNTGEISGEPAFIVASGDEWRIPVDRVRPLLVIDPEDDAQVIRLCRAAADEGVATNWDEPTPENQAWAVTGMQAALRSLIAPPKPEEPQGLGAVVEDGDGARFIRTAPMVGRPAWMNGASAYFWQEVEAVRVLSEGVTT